MARSPHALRLLCGITELYRMRKYFIVLLESCWQYENSLLQASQLMMFPHLSFASPPSTASRSVIPLCPVITSYSSFWGEREGRE